MRCARRAALLQIVLGNGDVYNVVRARAALGVEAVARGDSSRAVELLEPAVASVVGGGVREPNFFRLDADLVETLVRLGRVDEARRHLERLDRQAVETGGVWARAVAARCHALLAEDDELQERFEVALELHEHEPACSSAHACSATASACGADGADAKRASCCAQHSTRRSIGERP